MVLEIGKSWPEADVETAEAIDFLEFYAREMLRWGGEIPVTPYRGEFPETVYVPLGAGAVIPPWNFPNAILTGMTSAAVVTGNAVVLKPASDTPLVAWKVFTVLEEAGVPAGVLNYLPGPGSDVGDFLVEAPATRFISFTGSKQVGLGDPREGGRGREGPALDQAHRPRDGRQGLHRRGRGRRLRLRRLAGRRLGLRLPGPEVLGLLARDRPPAALQALRGRRDRADGEAQAGPDARPHELPGARRVRTAAQDGHRLRQDRQARSEARDGRDVERAGRQLRRPDGLLRREAVGAHLPGGDLRSRPRNHRGEGLRDGNRARERERVRSHGLVLRPRPLPHRRGQEAPPLRKPLHQPQVHRAPSSASTRSAASTCPARTARPAAATTSGCSCRRRASRRSCSSVRDWQVQLRTWLPVQGTGRARRSKNAFCFRIASARITANPGSFRMPSKSGSLSMAEEQR